MKKLIVIYLIVSVSGLLHATHNRAGEIIYKRIAPFYQVAGTVTTQVYTYSITVIKYTDHGSGIADRCVDTVYFGDNTSGVAIRGGITSTCNCGSYNGNMIGCGSIIVNDPGYIVKKNVYSIIHIYSGPGTYMISSSDPNRNQGVHNIPNSVNQPFYIESLLIINPLTGANSSPDFINLPVGTAGIGACFYSSFSAFDDDGDSLSFELTPCRGQNGQPVTGYSYPDANISFSIDPVGGMLTWCTPQSIGEYNIAVLVKEWRKNTSGIYEIIGSVLRDMQILVKSGVVGLTEGTIEEQVKIYPNPFNASIKLEFNENLNEQAEIYIYSNDGKLVCRYSHPINNGVINLSTTNVESGIYLLKIKMGKGVLYRKIVKY